MNIIPLVTSKEALVRLVLVLGISAGIFLLRIWLPRWPMKLWVRMTLGLMAVLALYSFGVRAPWAEKVMAQAGANEIVWNQQQNYGENGISLAFTMNVRNSIVPKPSGYSELSIANMAEGLNELVGASKASASNDKKPNVIFIMNEAFWDPTLLPGVKFNKDPLPTVHRLQKKTTSGYLLSPQFGGGTSNVEFEVLTGQSMSNLPAGPYHTSSISENRFRAWPAISKTRATGAWRFIPMMAGFGIGKKYISIWASMISKAKKILTIRNIGVPSSPTMKCRAV